ncbi:UTRA domain-containing protein [Nonomuraea sp. NPDC046802]|uniref:GntR family transcriptional regulator n=1 Tax=Nonomuraea sp. NPDC046802 TaxID=3154919 RepID=UPI003406DA2F
MSDGDSWTDISAPYVRPRPGRSDAWAEEAARRGHAGAQQLREVVEVRPAAEVADALGIPSGGTVIVRRRLVLLDELPVELADSYYPAVIARGTPLAEARKIRGGAVTLLSEMGYESHRIQEDVHARPATEEERQILQLGPNEWVLVLARLSMTRDGTPFEYSTMTMVARGRHLRYELSI